jgi:hypothetical protein
MAERGPLKRTRYEDRTLWDAKHPGLLAHEIKAMYRSPDVRFVFSYNPEHKLVQQHKSLNPDERLLFFRPPKGKISKMDADGNVCEVKNTNALQPTPGDEIRIQCNETKSIATYRIVSWLRPPGYVSGYCAIQAVS